MASKYEPLEIHLGQRSGSTARVDLTFNEIEQIIGSSLPMSAYRYREWWSNQADTSRRPQARAWTNAGYRVESVNPDRTSGRVSFRRA